VQNPLLQDLLNLSHEIGREDRGLSLPGEGNTSARVDDKTFLVKASGFNLRTLTESEVVGCRFSALLPLLEQGSLTADQVDEAVLASCVNPGGRKPSVETLFHAYLLSLPGVKFIAHCHPTFVNQILCSPRALEFAENRLFPYEVVCCGIASVYVPRAESGLKLAQAIRRETRAFEQRYACQPRTILLQNHGIITLGETSESALLGTLVAEKAARIFVGAVALGGPVYYPDEDVRRVAGLGPTPGGRPH
jgi:rhamnose utilization protein RhaD (predicted bifunctional aldolase and dehydrogenase)